jgi:SAM-dependent methyltransferase
MSKDLDHYASAYEPSFEFDFDNQLILSHYPQLVLNRVSHFGSLLELGLGHGVSTDAFTGKFAQHVVIEGSAKVIAKFKSDHPNSSIEIVHSYFEDFSTDQMFDIVIAGFVLEHVNDPESLMKRITTWVRPGGYVIVAVPNAQSLHRRIGVHAGLLANVHALSAGDIQLGHQRLFTKESLINLFRRSGLPNPEIIGLFLKPFTTNQLKELKLSKKVLDAMCTVGEDLPELCCALLAVGKRDE